VPSVPSGEKLDYGCDRSNELEDRGVSAPAWHCASARRVLQFPLPDGFAVSKCDPDITSHASWRRTHSQLSIVTYLSSPCLTLAVHS